MPLAAVEQLQHLVPMVVRAENVDQRLSVAKVAKEPITLLLTTYLYKE
jgi:hypothetical protein